MNHRICLFLVTISFLLACIAVRANASNDPGILYALLTDSFDCNEITESLVEVIDLDTMTTEQSISLTPLCASGLAVSMSGTTLYVLGNDIGFPPGNARVVVVDGLTGAETTTIALPGIFTFDVVLSKDGSRLYASTGSAVVQVDTATNAVLNTLNGSYRSLDVSSDGTTLAAAKGGNSLALIETANLTETADISLNTVSGGCSLFASDVLFTESARVVVWDRNCDDLYQVDLVTETQIVADSIVTPRDPGVSIFNSRLVYSPSRGQAYALKELASPVALDLGLKTGVALSDLSDSLAHIELSADESTLLVSDFSSSIDQYDIETGTVTEDVIALSPNSITADLEVIRDFRSGSVNRGAGTVTNVLFVNGQSRLATVPTGNPISVTLNAAPGGPGSDVDYVLWLWAGPPQRPQPIEVGGEEIGLFANPTPFQFSLSPQPFRCLDGGLNEIFCSGLALLGAAPSTAPWSLTRATGFQTPSTFTLQAVIEDGGSDHPSGLSGTNSVVLIVE